MSDDNPVLAEHPNTASNAFLMMRFSDDRSNVQISDAIRSALGRYGIGVLRADDKAFSDSLWSNVRAYMTACDLGIAVFEQLHDAGFNPNVSLELGYMLAIPHPKTEPKKPRKEPWQRASPISTLQAHSSIRKCSR